MQRELNREVTEFTKVSQPPYFIAYRANDEESASISSSFGSLTQSHVGRHRKLFVALRIGDYLFDNTRQVDEVEPGYMGMQDTELPLDDNEEVVANRIWKATDNQYRRALKRFNNLKTNLATKKDEKKIPDFSKEQVEKYYEPRGSKLEDLYNKEQWEQKTRQYSRLFLGESDMVSAEVSFKLEQERRYFVSSEGASIVQNFAGAYIYVMASIRATDGEVIPLHRSYYAATPAELPGDEAIETDIKQMIVTLQKLKTAPMADPYTGPALLDGPVAGVFFHEIFGHRVEGHRLRSENDGQTFKSKVNDKILPESMSVYCDPTLKQFAGKYLNGNYGFDDEGVKSARVTVVDKGVLKNFLMSRTPLDNFTHSNGHARAMSGLTPVSRQSNLFVDATKTKSSSDLRQMLIKECKRQKKDYGYFFKSVVGGFTNTDRYSPNAFNIFPTEVYKIYVDGRPDELVRGVDLIGTPLAMFAEISAVGDTHGVFVGFCGAESGYVPVSAVSPALFVRRIETQKKPNNKLEETILKAPVLTSKEGEQKTKDLSTIQQAMVDELKRNMDELKSEGFEKPFFINYAIQDHTVTNINASFGALGRSAETKGRTASSIRLLVGDYEFNDETFNSEGSNQQQDNEISLPIDDDYLGLRRSLWISTDNVYRGASRTYARNKEILKEKGKPLSEVPHRSFAKTPPSKIDIDGDHISFDKKVVEDYTRKLSATLNEFKELESGDVDFLYTRGYRYLVNSEGSMNRVPVNVASLSISARAQTKEGKYIGDRRTFELSTPELPPIDIAVATAKDLAKEIISSVDAADNFEEDYSGPVLIEGEPALTFVGFQVMLNEALGGMPSFRQPGKSADKIGKQIFSENMTVKATPKLKKYGNELLLGAFQVDDEGVVPADETILVENGVVKTMMMNRTITKEGQTSNGLGFGPGVLQISFKNTVPANTLKAKLIEMAKKEGLDYALMIRNANPEVPVPGMSQIYKVYVNDGREELVHNAVMGEQITERGFRKIMAVSTETRFANVRWISGYLSLIAPQAVIMGELELRPERHDNDRDEKPQPYVPSPRKK